MEITSKPVLKDVYTNSLYQSTFLPIFERAETKIKELVLVAFLFNRNKYFLRLAIAEIIANVSKKIPQDLHDKDVYLSSLVKKSEYYISKYYDKPLIQYNQVRNLTIASTPHRTVVPKIENPKQLYDLVQSKSLWAEAKGNPNVVNYPKEVKKYVNDLGGDPFTIIENGKHPISIWQKAELDVRYENQMQNLQNMRMEGIQYAWLSSHPNASKRCSAWQGELVALEGHAISPQTVVNHKTFKYNKSSFLIGKIDGHKVYSLSDIMDVVDDKYGYHNNIICGFNCRHRLIPYKGQAAPKEYTKEEIEQQRAIESRIRELERKIRTLKKKLTLFDKLNDKATIRSLKAQIKELTAYYKSFCEKNGYAYYTYRIDI